MGPYVIHDLSSSGAVHLATLDGEPMTSWISGCRLKKYNEPLTQEILERLHATKQRKDKKIAEKNQAQQEARERRNKLRRNRQGLQEVTELTKRMRICAIKETNRPNTALRPYIMVDIGTNYQPEVALVDSGADVNSLSYEAWQRLNKPKLCESTTTLRSFVGDLNPVEGYLDLPVYIGNTNVQHRFYVMKPGKMTMQVILGQPWQRTYNGVPNWRREGITFEYDHARLFTPFLTEEDFTTDSESENEEAIDEQRKESNATAVTEEVKNKEDIVQQTVEESNTDNSDLQQTVKYEGRSRQPQSKGHSSLWIPKSLVQAQKRNSQIWIPKTMNHIPPIPKKQQEIDNKAKTYKKTQGFVMTTIPDRQSQEVWVPKRLHLTQKESKFKWVPSCLKSRDNLQQQTRQTKRHNQVQTTAKKTNTRWILKQILMAQGYYEGVTHIWIPKKRAAHTATTHKESVQSQLEKRSATTQKKVWIVKDSYKQGQTKAKQTICKTSDQPTKRATRQEKGKWIPKTNEEPMDSTVSSCQGLQQYPGKTIQNARTLEAAQQLAFILRAFYSQKIRNHLKWLWTIKAISQRTSSAKALGPHMLQDLPLAPH